MPLEFKKAVRRATPMLIAMPGVSGSGKTYSALLLAAGIAGKDGKVGMIDAENGRGSMYADSPGIMKAMPNGYDILQLDPPFPPERYIEAIDAAETSGIRVLVIDSTSHEWEGTGGCQEIAETHKLKGMPNWALAKRSHKRFVNRCLFSTMHFIFCLRARDKVKILKVNGREEVIPVGIQPIAEKNFVFEATLSLMLEEGSHFATPIKVPEPLAGIFPGGRMITREDGERIRQWADGGEVISPAEQLRKRARAVSEDGMAAYTEFFGTLTAAQKKELAASTHAENKALAESSDKDRAASTPRYETWEDWGRDGNPPHAEMIVAGGKYAWDENSGSHRKA